MKDRLNARVKHREGFRPYAPAVLEERASDWFVGAYPSPFMLLVFRVREDRRAAIPAVTHVDGTARVQMVRPEHSERLYRLLQEFDALTGVPVLVNTSFNVKGEPIACTPTDALRCFYSSGIDGLAIEGFWVEKA